ncbi:MAG TPA: alkaline phosphatase D family protein, partial [Burkholderiaceae bacterium]|nr:alkaline phosphatase D family protein [Burkholderiaceae bacterium]
LGGCPMADCFEAGVVDDQGRVWRAPNERWANLWVLDGSIVPTSLGCNPLWTITALAERAMAHLTKDAKAMSPGSVMPKAPSPVPREPMPLVREAAPRFAVRLSERLEMRELPVRGALRKAFSPDARVDAGLTLNMSTPDWRAVWDHPDHCFDQISGRLRLVASREEPADDEQLVYDIASGQVCLLAEARSLPLIGWLLRVEGTIRAAASWWILRGRRDSAMTRRREGLSSWQALVKFWPQRWAMLRIWWQGGTERQVRYALTLQRTGPAGAVVGGPDAPATLRLHGVKRVSYAATWCQLAVYLWRSLLGWLQGAPRQHPADLRPAYVDQLTRPVITLMEPGWRSLLPGRKTQARFEFDPQRVLQKSPVDLFGGGDSSAAMIALMAYPLLVLRHALQTRVLDFRLPDYSGRPVVDGWDTGDVSLRAEPAGTARPVHPELHVLKVRRGRSSSDDATEDGRLIRLPLWRYRRPDGTPSFEPGTWNGEEVRRVRSVLLMHAFAMSGSTYTLKTIPCNLAEYLYAKGYEVWVLDTRMSPRVEGSLRPGTLDQVGLIDAPAAVDKILELLEADLVGVEPGAPLQIFSFAHCFGAGAMLMGLLGGKLSYPPPLNHPAGAPLMPKLAGLVCSQVHPFMVGSRRSQAKTWIPAFVRDAAARMTIPLAVRTAAPTILEALVDRLFASMPVPSSERCPKEGYVSRKHEDDCATCRRIRFLDGDLFKHKHLNPQTHDLLTSLFGDGSVRLFAHGARIVEYERLVTEDGLNAYATDEAMARYLALPMRFVHGKDNDLFDKESATRSAEQFRRIQPAWSEQFKLTAGPDEPADLIDDYGHLDILIGEHAHKEVYPRLVGLFDAVLRTPAQPCAQPPVVATQLQVRFPKLGPWIGPVRTNGTWSSVDLAFVIDDMRTEASLGAPGTALVATAIVSGLPGGLRAVPMPVQVYKAPILARDGFAVGKLRSQLIEASVVRVARATIRFPAQTQRLSIEMVSHARAPVGPISPFGRGGRPTFREAGTPLKGELDLEPAVTAELSVQPGLGDAAQLSELRHAIAQACRFAWQARKAARQPFPASHSQLLQNPIAPHRRRAVLLPHALQALGPPDPVRIAVGCCRYPGFPFDRGRADAAFKRLLALQSGPMEGRVRLGMMLGDQIYADATAGYVDPLSPVERYVGRHMNAFHSPAVQRLMAQLPMVLAPDDHEFGNDYPNGPPLFGGTANGRADAAVRNMWRRKAAIDAIAAFQQSAFKLTHGVGTFETGAVRYLVLDSRTDREPVGKNPFQILTKPQLQAIRHWVKQGRKTKQFHVLCSGSVIWPSLVPDGDPGNRGPDDSWREASIQRARLLELLASRLPGRFAVVSGDYHVSFAGLLAYRGEPVGVCIVAPPFYAPLPYANAAPHELDWKECLALPGGSSLRLRELSPVKRGSGYGVLTIQQREKAWEVAFAVDLLDMETGADWTGLKPMAKWRL